MQMTITEALAEIKTIAKRLQNKREAIGRYLARQDGQKDPLEKEGGSVEFIRREMQAISDLCQRIVDIRTGIQQANLSTSIVVLDQTKTVAEWLAWRKEVAPGMLTQLRGMIGGLGNVRQQAQQKGFKVVANAPATELTDVLVNVDESKLTAEIERTDQILSTLDGRLSLVNATTTITLAD